MTPVATAPGKLLLAGEYAVLDGGPAVVAAVSRRVIARASTLPVPATPFLAAVADVVAAERGPGSAAARAARHMSVDSDALHLGGIKLGLGSSAAATVAAVACAISHDDATPDEEVAAVDRELVHRLAREAHGNAQGARGARGSGADVAACTYGGILRFAGDAATAITLPTDLILVPFWTGTSADTTQLVLAVNEARAARPREVGAALTAIADAAGRLAEALDAAHAIAALDAGAQALAALGQASQLDLETDPIRRVRRLSAPLGGAAKSCGAGGGDVGIAFLPPGADTSAFRVGLVEAGCSLLDLSIDPSGVDIVVSTL